MNGGDDLTLAERIRKGFHFVFYSDEMETEMKRFIVRTGIAISVGSFLVFVYMTFVRGWGG